MNRRSPEGFTIGAFPGDRCNKNWNWRYVPTQSWRIPGPFVPLPELATRCLTVSPIHARHGDSLFPQVTRVSSQEKIQITAGTIQHHAEVAVAPGKVSVLCITF